MKLKHNWKEVLRYAWSIRLDVLNIIFTLMAGIVPVLTGTAISPFVLSVLFVAGTAGSMWLRLLHQDKLSGPDEPSP